MTTWTDERVELLKKRWSEGLTGGQIAKELGGCTRSAVISKVRRIGLPGRANREANQGKPGAIALLGGVGFANRNFPVPITLPEEPPQDLSQFACLSIIDLESSQCRWAVGEDRTVIGRYLFCGAEKTAGSEYCAVHWRRSMTPDGYRHAMEAKKAARKQAA